MSANDALFPALLGPRWNALPARVRALHGAEGEVSARGCASVSGNPRWPARLLRGALGLPAPCTNVAVDITINREGFQETWRRRFAGAHMDSHLRRSSRHPQAFEERLGAACLAFTLDDSDGGLRWVAREVRFLGVPLPLRWFDGIDARCSEREGRYRFDINVRLPGLGLLVAYAGWLEVVDAR
ncbi:MAG TPA: DUF4166 domain-containing protein [Dokdonella sp.]